MVRKIDILIKMNSEVVLLILKYEMAYEILIQKPVTKK